MFSAFTVSICLPTCNRPELIAQCIDSCLAQTHPPLEILIGDDSKDDRTERLIVSRYAGDARIRYTRNDPPLGQARNVDSLFAKARGEKIMLIHDDDFLVTDGIEQLASLWNEHPQLEVAFGDQYAIEHDGRIDFDETRQLNALYHRVAQAEGMQTLPGRTGLVQMMPNNGWLANANLVKRIGYDGPYAICCDFVFNTRLCLAARQVCYRKAYISCYRLTATSVSQSTRGSLSAASVSAFEFVRGLTIDEQLEPSRRLSLRRLAPIVVSVYARNGAPLKALQIAFAHLFAYNYGFSLRFGYHLLVAVRAALRSARTRTAAVAD